jgi:hypothetical protein
MLKNRDHTNLNVAELAIELDTAILRIEALEVAVLALQDNVKYLVKTVDKPRE